MIVKKLTLVFFLPCLLLTNGFLFVATGLGDERGTEDKEITQGLRFYDPFDSSGSPVLTSCANDVTRGTVPIADKGAVGTAVTVTNEPIWIRQHNICNSTGTIAFWIQPQKLLNSRIKKRGEATFFSYGQKRITMTPVANHGMELFFRTGTEFHKDGFLEDSTCRASILSWKPNQWHHIAVVWDRNKEIKTLFLDGECVSRVRTNRIDGSARLYKTDIAFGAANIPAAYDELMIWDRTLSKNEIATLFKHPATIWARRTNRRLDPTPGEYAAAASDAMFGPACVGPFTKPAPSVSR